MSAISREEQGQIIQEIRKFDTATIRNVLAAYPGSNLCLSLYAA